MDKKWLINNEKLQIKCSYFFAITSKITAFFLFSKIGNVTLSFFIAVCFYLSANYFRLLVAIFADESLFVGLKLAAQNLPYSLICLFLFNLLLVELCWINTFFILCPSINAKIKLMYGEHFIKKRFYNSTYLSAKAAINLSKSVAIGVGIGVAGGFASNIIVE